jgi:phospholipase C
VINTVFDHTSVLKLIEWRFGLSPLTARDASSDVGNIMTALNLTNPNTKVPALPNPSKPQTSPCIILPAGTSAPSGTAFGKLAQSELMRGWNVK